MEVKKAKSMWTELLYKGVPKLLEQGIAMILLIAGILFFIHAGRESAIEKKQMYDSMIEYLKNDQLNVVKAIDKNTTTLEKQIQELQENNRLMREMLSKK